MRAPKPPAGYRLTGRARSRPGDLYICILDHVCLQGPRRWRRVAKGMAWCGERSGEGGFAFARPRTGRKGRKA